MKKLFIPDFILIQETIDKFGYDPNELYGVKSYDLYMVCKCNICSNIYESKYSSCLIRYKKGKKCKYCSNKENSIIGSDKRSIKLKKNYLNGYIHPMLGKKHKDDTKKKMSENRIGKSYDEIYGIEKSKIIKDKISKSTSGDKNPFYGKKHTKESIERMSNIQKNIVRRGEDCNFFGKNYNKLMTNEQFIQKCILKHGDLYDYSLTKYKSYNDFVDIICKKHGIFKQKPSIHLSGCGCQKCNNSIGETLIENYLIEKEIKYEKQYTFDDCFYKKKLLFDFYLLDYNICIEYDGEFHYKDLGFNDLESQKIKDNIKNEYCSKKNIHLLRIPYFNREMIKDIINNFLNV